MIEDKIKRVIDEKIKPYLREHNGDIEVIEIENNVLKIRLLGQCSNCASAKYTVENLVETCIKKAIPEIDRVELESSISEEMLDMARKILSRKCKDR
ncbi:NifU family protein [Clostridium sp. PL3]|uniref:NifU family protein n=1 Tax=Clostridium thailandense TaxID=2794346 RepID=A0A949TJ99_9CLOT|nr:NifU family protein [Clostridium thailandense]MBV7273330.1 NifU family protein [Clostridium thailandense]